MVTSNTFAELSVLPPPVVQVFIVLMIMAVVVGTLVDRLNSEQHFNLIVATKRIFECL